MRPFCFAFLVPCAAACAMNLSHSQWTGIRGSARFNDLYSLNWVAQETGNWSVTLLNGPHDSWTTGAGQLAADNASTTVHFSNGVHQSGKVVSCARIDWTDGTSWVPAATPQPPAPNPPGCAAIKSPAPCGQQSDSEERCLSKGCCYDPAAAYPCYFSTGNAVPITHVHVIQASHFDAGFAYTIKDVLQLWWYTHFPRATALGQAIEANASLASSIGLRFTAQMWLIEMFFNCPPGVPGLRCPTAAEQQGVTTAIEKGWLTWHSFPFNSELDMHSPAMLQAGMQLAHSLDDRFGFPHKATVSQRDVPGTSRSIIPVFATRNVTAMSIGVNGASTPPFVPRVFLWKDGESGLSMPMMVHPYGYGGTDAEDAVILPGLGHAMVTAWRGDNAGPPSSVQEIEGDFASIRSRYPGASVFSSTFDNFTSHFVYNSSLLAQLPVVTSELGDTWLHGAASDPVRTAFFKRAGVLLEDCLASGACAAGAGDAALTNATRFLLKCGEHTWGKDIKTFLHDTENWTNQQLQQMLAKGAPNFVDIVASWQEQRDWCITYALGALPPSHPLAQPLAAALADLTPPPSQPSPTAGSGFAPFPAGTVYTKSASWDIAFSGAVAGISYLKDKRAGIDRVWADAATDGSFLAQVWYTALSSQDYYVFTGPEPDGYYPFPGDPPDWFGKDFGKPNVSSANPVHSETPAALAGLFLKENSTHAIFLLHASWLSAQLHTYYGAPSDVWLQLEVPLASGEGIAGTLMAYGKTPTRLPEGLFFRHNASAGGGWRVGKLTSSVDPFDVVPGGNHHQHAYGRVVRALSEVGDALNFMSDHFALAHFGPPIPLPAPVWANSTSRSEGMSFLLMDNTWGCVPCCPPAPLFSLFANGQKNSSPRTHYTHTHLTSHIFLRGRTNYPAWIPWKEGEGDSQWRFEIFSEPPPPPPPSSVR